MARFPPEVLAEICQHLENDKDTLKALRLVNQFLGVEASKYLYKILLVYPTPRSWKRLHSVAFCQHLTHYPEELVVATLEYLPVYANFEAWALATSKTRLVAQESSSSIAGAAAVVSDADRYESYRQWQNGEQELLRRMTTMKHDELASWDPSIDGVTFPSLHTIRSLGAHELWPWTPEGPTNRRERETAVLESRKPNTKTCKRMSAHLCCALQIFHVSGGLGVNIVSLELNRYREILVEQTFNIPALRTLRRLTLSFPSGPEEEIYSKMWGPWKLAPWLRNARELRVLKILTQDLENSWRCAFLRNVVRLFKDAPWPKLGIIHFKETFMTSEYLLPFLKKRVHTLELLSIEEPLVKKDDWHRLADKIRMMFSTTTCCLELTDPHPAAEDKDELNDNDNDSFFTPELHPDIDGLHWNQRHEYSHLLGNL